MTGLFAARITGFLAPFALLLTVSQLSWAAPRRVAIVNAATDQAAGAQGATQVRRMVAKLTTLEPLASGDLSRALEGPLASTTEIDRSLARASKAMEQVKVHLQSFGFDLALAELSRAETALVPFAHVPRARAALAELNLQRGVVYMGKPDRAAALEAFHLVRILAPERTTLDVDAYDPVIVQTFASAGAARPNDARLEITTAYDGATLYVDGVSLSANLAQVAAGWHLVTATFPEHRSAGSVIEIKSGQTRTIKLDLWPQSSIERATALRRQLLLSRDATAYRAVAQAVANLSASDAVIIVRGAAPGELNVAVFDQRDDTVSAWIALVGAVPRVLLADILPKTRVIPIPQPPGGKKPPPPPPWYKERKWQWVMGSSAAVTVAGILVLSLTGDDNLGSTGGTFSNPFE